MDRYQRVEKPRAESSTPINENEIRITAQGLIRNYITYATTLLHERHASEIVFKAMGQAISKAVAIAEIIKKRIPGLHQDTSISSTRITDVWEPIEEGLVPLEMTRHVSMISISLSTKELNKNSPGYQPPLHGELPRAPRQHQQPQQHQVKLAPAPVADDSYVQGRARGRGRGRGRGWGGRGGYGGGRGYNGGAYGVGYGGGYGGGYDGHYGGGYDGGYGGGYGGGYQDNGGWNYNGWNRGGGRSRGWGGYRGGGYERGRGNPGGGRGFARGPGGGRMGNRGRGGNQG